MSTVQFSSLTPDEQKYVGIVQDIMGPSWVVQDDQRLRLARVLMGRDRELERLREAVRVLMKPCAEFVQKVETGGARSKRYYAAFKEALHQAFTLTTTPPKV